MQPPRLCYITDRKALEAGALLPRIVAAIRAGIDLIQIREKDLATRELMAIVEPAVAAAKGTATRIVVNDRLDVALAFGAAGVHLGTQSIPAEAARRIVPDDFLIGVSCHSLEEARGAEAARADYIIFGPVFETASKLQYGSPLGLEKLREVAGKIRVPILALAGITVDRVKSCLEAGAAGIAGISIFQSCPSIEERVRELGSQFPLVSGRL